MPTASAPGKFILFGEHAVVYGKPAIAMAIDIRTAATAVFSERTAVDGLPLKEVKSYYIKEIMRRWKGDPVSITINSGVPPSSGLGSSAALSVAMVGALHALDGNLSLEDVAKEAFDIEYTVQGGASPTDTSTSTLGGAVMVGGEQESPVWRISRGGRTWSIGRIDAPELSFVVGVTNVHSPTKLMVQKVKKLVERSPLGMEVIDDIGELVRDSAGALRRGDPQEIGELMNRNHRMLEFLGVSCSEIEEIREAVKDISFGSKLTGAGGGGSVVVLTDKPDEVKKRIERLGSRTYAVNLEKKGIIWD